MSVTTRPRRAGEVDGVHYFFWPEERFREEAARGGFLEWARVFGNYYGTPAGPVAAGLEAGEDVLLDLDIQGARQVKLKMPDAVLVFIFPPSLEALQERMRRRGTETDEECRLRLSAAVGFMRAAREFDYAVLNDDLEEATRKLEAIVVAERCRSSRQEDLIRRFTEPAETRGESRS